MFNAREDRQYAVMLLAHKIALDPNMAQRRYFVQAAGTARFAWNWALGEWGRQSLRRQLNGIKRKEFVWMYVNPNLANFGCAVTTSLSFSGGTSNCNGANRWVSDITVGLWQNLYNGDIGRFTAGLQYEYISRKLFVASTPHQRRQHLLRHRPTTTSSLLRSGGIRSTPRSDVRVTNGIGVVVGGAGVFPAAP
jgi:hypothetical protein